MLNSISKQILKRMIGYSNINDVDKINQMLVGITELSKENKIPEVNFKEAIHVALLLSKVQMGTRTILASLSYYALRKTNLRIKKIFHLDTDTLIIIQGLNEIDYMKRCYHTSAKRIKHSKNFRRLLLAVCPDIRTIIIELARQLDICRHLPERNLTNVGKRKRALKTFYIYAPIAGRLGIEALKWRLQDAAFHQLQPKHYQKIVSFLKDNHVPRMQYIKKIRQDIKKSIQPLHLRHAVIYGRPKHIYSIYHKLVTKHKNFNQIYDFLAVRVITDTIRQCYAVLSVLQTKWKPVKNRFKDYIAKPKVNLYQSIHTTVTGPDNKPLEIQIRTYRMHQIDEYGVAAHWAYKRGIKNKVHINSTNHELNLFKQMITMRGNSHNPYNLKSNLFDNHVYVFTPNRDVLELPVHSGPLDMAYKIHTEVGNHAIGAKVNGNIVSWDYQLNDGDRISILTSNKSSGPSRDWLNLVVSTGAKRKIRRCLRKEHRNYNISQGKNNLNQAINEQHLDGKVNSDLIQKLSQKENFKSKNKFFEALGLNEVTIASAINTLTRLLKAQEPKDKSKRQKHDIGQSLEYQAPNQVLNQHKNSHKGIIIAHSNDFLFHLSHCCYPLPGDKIVGYITKNKGISIHRVNCPELKKMPHRLVKTYWADNNETDTAYLSSLEIFTHSRWDTFTSVINLAQYNARQLLSIQDYNKNDVNVIRILIRIENLKRLNELISALRNIKYVYKIIRL